MPFWDSVVWYFICFQAAKDSLSEVCVLCSLLPYKFLDLLASQTDVSDMGIGVVLEQLTGGKWHYLVSSIGLCCWKVVQHVWLRAACCCCCLALPVEHWGVQMPIVHWSLPPYSSCLRRNWLCLVAEFLANVSYLPGCCNVVTNMLSHFPISSVTFSINFDDLAKLPSLSCDSCL